MSAVSAPGAWLRTSYRVRDRQVILLTGKGDDSSVFQVPLDRFLAHNGITLEEVTAVLERVDVPPIDLTDVTPYHRIALAALPADLTGQTVLDIGGYDGLFAGECVRRGASLVRIIDNGEWQNYHWRIPPTPPGVERVGCDVLEWEQPADLIVFGNVIYHMRDPWRALRHLRTLCRGRMLMWTCFIPTEEAVWQVEPLPAPTNDNVAYEGNFTVYWRPSVPGLVRVLERTGWTDIEEVGRTGDHVVFLCRGGPL